MSIEKKSSQQFALSGNQETKLRPAEDFRTRHINAERSKHESYLFILVILLSLAVTADGKLSSPNNLFFEECLKLLSLFATIAIPLLATRSMTKSHELRKLDQIMENARMLAVWSLPAVQIDELESLANFDVSDTREEIQNVFKHEADKFLYKD